MSQELTKNDLEVFLTEWEEEFLEEIEFLRIKSQRISRKQREKLKEIENKLQEIENEIKIRTRNTNALNKVVNHTRKVWSINFRNFIFLKTSDVRFTILTSEQKKAIKNIKKYWIDRVKNYRNWKTQKHWSKAKVTISSRIEKTLYDSVESLNIQKIIQNFVRRFLRNSKFREIFLEILDQQYKRDMPIPIEGIDLTDWFGTLTNIYPNVVSGKVLTIEKELFTFYFTFCSEFSVSYAIRVALIHFRNELPQEPIERNEISLIMQNLLKDFINNRG